MKLKSFAEMDCSIAQCLEVVGERWSLLILRDVFLGYRRFEQIHQRLGISRNILQDRLTKLVESGVLVREPYQERPRRDEYRLTAKGRDLWPVLTAMREWGDVYGAPDGPPIELIHDGCGHVTHTELRCAWCGERLQPRSVHAVAGPGRAPLPDRSPA